VPTRRALHRIADNGERFHAGLVAGGYVVRFVEIALIDLGSRNEAVDVDGVRALDLDCLQLVLLDLHILPFAQFVTAAFLVAVDGFARVLVNHLLPKPIAGLFVDLMKVRLLRLRRGREELDRTSDK
jgi:hypothetical protein